MLFLITVTVLLASAQAKFYTDCGSKLATVQGVGVSGCADDATECILKRNSNATISIQFTPSKDVKSLSTEVHGVIMNLPVPFPLPQPDACRDNGLACPLKAGQVAHYQTSLPVLKSYPKVKVDVKWELKNEDEEDLVCVMIPARIH
ncbi:ecdysteroid-regulated 16 kDa protein [Plodia interpunctella]|uniref:ecdysteroid-regulated 16 kDa protein n=1 Tax=Plodia interpunctella TaxID=58824 RepID=UPI0023689B80|nr:ecdysteroid-regulated 16 kDa protein [Plodia interpunctella]